MIDYTILLIYIILGIPLIFSYLFLAMQPKHIIDKFWKYKSSSVRNIYSISIFLCFVSGLYLLYYFTYYDLSKKLIFNHQYDSSGKYYFYVGFLLFIGLSLLWIPTINYPIINKIILLFVSLGSFLITISLICNNFDTLVIIASIYLTFHTFILDFLFY